MVKSTDKSCRRRDGQDTIQAKEAKGLVRPTDDCWMLGLGKLDRLVGLCSGSGSSGPCCVWEDVSTERIG